MVRYAKLDENNKVIVVTLLKNEAITDENGNEQEQLGIDYLNNLLGGVWKQTFKDGTRKNKAGKGYIFDEARDAFIGSQPYPSWTLNEDTCQWDAPTARPDDDKFYTWNEDTTSWEEVI